MYKFLHRLLTIVIIIITTGCVGFIIRQAELPLIFGFLLLPIIVVPMCLFQKVPMKCDQAECKGVAKLECGEIAKGKWYRHLLLSGHRCDKCEHLIPMPKNNTSDHHH